MNRTTEELTVMVARWQQAPGNDEFFSLGEITTFCDVFGAALVESLAEEQTERFRRIYYQDIVYSVCNVIDQIRGNKPGSGIVCGTSDEPSTQVQKEMWRLKKELEAFDHNYTAVARELWTVGRAIDQQLQPIDRAITDFEYWQKYQSEAERQVGANDTIRTAIERLKDIRNNSVIPIEPGSGSDGPVSVVQWKDVEKDGVPEHGGLVLVAGGMAFYGDASQAWKSGNGPDYGRVLEWQVRYWAELPAPPIK